MTSSDKEMSFLDHLEVFRWHLIRAATAILFFAVIAFVFRDFIFDGILLALRDPDFFTYKMCCNAEFFLPIYKSPIKDISTSIKW